MKYSGPVDCEEPPDIVPPCCRDHATAMLDLILYLHPVPVSNGPGMVANEAPNFIKIPVEKRPIVVQDIPGNGPLRQMIEPPYRILYNLGFIHYSPSAIIVKLLIIV